MVRYVASGQQSTLNYLVMEQLGENLSDLRMRANDHRFTLPTTFMAGLQMLEAVLSAAGEHRDGPA